MMIYALDLLQHDHKLIAEARKYGIVVNPSQGTIASRDEVKTFGNNTSHGTCRTALRLIIKTEKEKREQAHLAKQTSLL